ncbi:RRQRL motif-containing zinc-binding protein [Amycolatopsis thermoflava]|uniref:RRQRL motif-containing zinc-binding protein n=1 Tax=Amycolatopsis thermoflava TaxID=84480 RepID=UPI003D76332E
MALLDLELWDGRHTWCHGYREGLPWWRWGWAPAGLRTRRQIHAAGRRLARGQDPYGLIVWKRGRRTAALYRLDLTLPAARVTPAKRAAVAAMERARRTCRRCQRQRPYRMPMSTWRCWECMAETGDYGEPAVA